MSDTGSNADEEMSREALASLLAFYAESGLDFPITDEAANHFETAPPVTIANVMQNRATEAEPKRPAASTANATIPDTQAVAMANAAAENALSLDELAAAVGTFDGCNLKRTARHTVFEGGNRDAPLMIVQAAPSRDDDASGQALSGAQGRLLTAMMAAIGMDVASDCYLGFCVPWCPPGGADPTALHLGICEPFIRRQIALSKAKHLLILGNIPARQILETSDSILHLRGKWTDITIGGMSLPAMATHQPAVLMNEPSMKRFAWSDLLAFSTRVSADQ